MKKLVVFMILILSVLSSCGSNSESNQSSNLPDNSLTQPERKLDVYWKINSIEWNEITLLQVDISKDPTFNMSSDEKKKYMQSMDERARMALKEEIAKSTLWEIKITIPVWIPMTKKESQWPTSPSIEASLADLKIGQYISIWLNNEIENQKIAEFVKISFTQ